jgi:hypothetical protein
MRTYERTVYTGKANNDEEYKKAVKLKMNAMIVTFLIGVMTLTCFLLAKNVWAFAISQETLSIYSAFGSGLIAVSVAQWIKHKLILADPEKRKKSRLEHTDERIREISNKAFKIARILLVTALYIAWLIGGLFNPILAQ